jgi:hypothetical protein
MRIIGSVNDVNIWTEWVLKILILISASNAVNQMKISEKWFFHQNKIKILVDYIIALTVEKIPTILIWKYVAFAIIS